MTEPATETAAIDPSAVPSVELAGGVRMPVLGLGVWQIPDGDPVEQAVTWALEAGYRHIDTATLYRNERGVGRAIAASGIPREELFVTTKWLPMRRGPRVELARSLERLGLEQVDLYLIHWPVPGRVGSAWRTLAELREAGLARSVGVSNFGAERLRRLVAGGAPVPAVDQVHFSPFHHDRQLVATCAELGVVLEAYSPLDRGGALSHPTIVEVAGRVGRTPAQVMIRWGLQKGAVVIPKSADRERIRSNAQVFDFELGPDEMRALDELSPPG